MWDAKTSQVLKLTELDDGNGITSLAFDRTGDYLGLGNNKGKIELWDVNRMKLVREFKGHTGRIGAISMTDGLIASGSRDKSILVRDIRDSKDSYAKLASHKQEI